MYLNLVHRSKPVPTLLSFLKTLGFFSIFSAQFVSITGRKVHNYLLYSDFNPEILNDPSSLEEWASVQGIWNSLQSNSKPIPDHQHFEPKVGSPTYGASPTPTSPPVLDQHELARLHRRDTSSNVCTISVQTTVYVAIDGASTMTVSSSVGSRPTGIPGDTNTTDGTDTTGGESGTGTSGGQSFGSKEGLITGLVIVLLILLASFCALFTYFYKKRRNARIQRMSSQPYSDTVRRVGSKGLMSLSNSARGFSRSQWSPLTFFRGLVGRLSPPLSHGSERDSQSSELLERKRPVERTGRGKNAAWSGKFAAEPNYGEKHLDIRPTETRTSGNFLPEIISSPTLSSLKLPSLPKPAAQLSSGEYSPVDRRNSRGEPLSPRAWIAGFGLASRSHVDPFANPSYVSSNGDHQDSVQFISRTSEPGTPLSNASLSSSDRTPREQQRHNPERPSGVTVPSDVRPDGASDIISTFGSAFGDRHSSDHTVSTIDDDRLLSTTQMVWYHPLSDVEEVLTPVSDERLSIQPGSSPFMRSESPGRQQLERNAHISLSAVRRSRPLSQLTESDNPFTDNKAGSSLSSPPLSQGRRLVPSRRESDVTSLLPSERSTSVSLTGTSIVDLGPPIDTGNWDDAIRRQEEDQLFYKRPGTSASGRRRF